MIPKLYINDSGVTKSLTVFCTNISGVRGTTVEQDPNRVVVYYVSLPREFFLLHNFVTLLAYVMFVNGAPLLINISWSINIVLIEHLHTRMSRQLSKSFKSVMKIVSRSNM